MRPPTRGALAVLAIAGTLGLVFVADGFAKGKSAAPDFEDKPSFAKKAPPPPPDPTAPAGVPVFPQVKITHVDTKAWPMVKLHVSFLDTTMRPVQLKVIKKVEVLRGDTGKGGPIVQFVDGQPLEDKKEAKLEALEKTEEAHAMVAVIAGHQDPALREGSLGKRLKEAASLLFKPLGEKDRANAIWYNDRIYTFMGLKGKQSELADMEMSRAACRQARLDALTDLPLPGTDPESQDPAKKGPPPGTDLCGLTGTFKPVVDLVKSGQTAYEGFFPRLFNVGPSFLSAKRYCALPRQALKTYGQFTPDNIKVMTEKREAAALRGEQPDFETSAMDEALELLLRDGKPSERKALILVSDGRDGYLDEVEDCKRLPPPPCDKKEKEALRSCLKSHIDKMLTTRQAAFRQKAVRWLGLARGAGIRIFAVGLGMLGQPHELERLRLLAERSGGTYRGAANENTLANAVADTVAELKGQYVVTFKQTDVEELPKEISYKVRVTLDPTVSGNATIPESSYTSDKIVTAVPKDERSWFRRGRDKVEDLLVAMQEKLGYSKYVIIGTIVLVVIGLLALLILFLILRGIVRLFSRGDAEAKA